MADHTQFKDLALPALDKGLKVCRLRPNDKRPLSEGWVEEATSSKSVVEGWNAENPAYNCGAVVTRGCGYWVVDVDCLQFLMDSCPHEILPRDTYVVQTGGGGRHYYFSGEGPFDSIKHVKNPSPEKYKKADGSECKSVMDVVCDRGQVLVAGNVHPKTRKPYAVLQDCQLAECPPSFLAWLRKTVEGRTAERPKAQSEKKQGKSILVRRGWVPEVELAKAGLKFEAKERDGKVFLNYHALMPEGCLKKGGKHHTADGTEEGNECCGFVVRDLGFAWDLGHACHTGCGGGGTIECLAALGIEFKEIVHVGGVRRAVLDRGDSIPPEPISWLWPRYIPRGKLTSFAGLQAQGKSPVTRDLVARVTSGADWPDGTPNDLGKRTAIIVSFEDDWESVMVPALAASGADPSKYFRFRMTQSSEEADSYEVQMALDQDIAELARVAREVEAVLIVIDPATSFLGNLHPNKEEKVRPMLDRLSSDLADACNASVLFTGHLNKKPDLTNANQRMMGCAAWTGVPRANLFADDDSEAEETDQYSHVFYPHRTPNKGPALKYKTKQVSVTIAGKTFDEVVVVEWGGEADMVSEVFAQSVSKADRGRAAEAGELVAKMIRDSKEGQVAVSVIAKELARLGYEDLWKNSGRIKKKVPAVAVKEERITFWKLKQDKEQEGMFNDKENGNDC